jgi:acyl carrier protein
VETSDDLQRSVLAIVADVAEVPPETIAPDALLADLDIDSLRALRIVAEVERRWNIVIGEAEIGSIRSMRDILALVERKSPPKSPPNSPRG